MRAFSPIIASALAAVLLAGCGSSSTNSTTAPSTPAGPITESFASVLAAGGGSSRTFVATQAGAVTVGLTDANPDIKVGLGVGIPNVLGTICSLTYSLTTSKSS